MFSISQIKEAHSKVKSGADFPNYIKDLIALGVKSYDTFVSDGHSEYNSTDGYTIKSDTKYSLLDVSDTSDSEKFKHYLKIHQQGQTDYLTFCNHCAECGIEKWRVDMANMTCTYYTKTGTEILAEKIPA